MLSTSLNAKCSYETLLRAHKNIKPRTQLLKIDISVSAIDLDTRMNC